MTPRELAQEHLHTLKQSLLDWKKYQERYSLVDLKSDRDVQNMVLHALLTAIQSCIDIANYLVSDFGLPKPTTYWETFEILANHGYLEDDISKELQDLASIRNILVHIYWKLNLKRVNEILQEKRDNVEAFAKQIVSLLKTKTWDVKPRKKKKEKN